MAGQTLGDEPAAFVVGESRAGSAESSTENCQMSAPTSWAQAAASAKSCNASRIRGVNRGITISVGSGTTGAGDVVGSSTSAPRVIAGGAMLEAAMPDGARVAATDIASSAKPAGGGADIEVGFRVGATVLAGGAVGAAVACSTGVPPGPVPVAALRHHVPRFTDERQKPVAIQLRLGGTRSRSLEHVDGSRISSGCCEAPATLIHPSGLEIPFHVRSA